jgi:hypothetical protein
LRSWRDTFLGDAKSAGHAELFVGGNIRAPHSRNAHGAFGALREKLLKARQRSRQATQLGGLGALGEKSLRQACQSDRLPVSHRLSAGGCIRLRIVILLLLVAVVVTVIWMRMKRK